MALARIISSSRECARELALNLMDRGYAVEIVSPDAIPDDLADLELRVESDPGNTLAARVKARDGVRSASLGFIHHLESAMAESDRRRLESGAPAPAPTEPTASPAVSVASAEQDIVENARILLGSGEASEAVPTKPATLMTPREAAREVIAPEPPQTPPEQAERPSKFVVKVIIPRRRSASNRAPGRGGRFWRAASTFGGALLVAFALRTAAIRLSGTAAISSHKTSAVTVPANGKVQAAKLSGAPVATHVSPVPKEARAAAAVPDSGKNGRTPSRTTGSPTPMLKKARAPRVKATASNTVRSKLHHSADDLVAPDTITYFDEGARPIRIEQFPHHPALPRKHDAGVFASKAVSPVDDETAR